MTRKPRPTWPSDDQVREHNRDTLAGDGRKLEDSEHVGGRTPDADPDPPQLPAQPGR